MAGRGTRAAAVYAGHRVPRQRNSQTVGALNGRISRGLERGRDCRGPGCDNRIPLGRGSIRSTACLVQRQVSVIAALTTPSAVAAKAATGTIPIVFSTIGDPVQIGLVASLRRPGGNITGATYLNVEVGPKLLELLHEVVPTATTVAALVNPTNPNAEILTNSLQVAARTLGLDLHVLKASTERDINTAFETLIQQRVGGLVVPSDVFLITHEEQLAALALRHRVPAISQTRAFAAAGGLMSYAGSALGAYRQAGAYTGRVLKGEKPADLPVQQTTKVELIVNLKTAKALGLVIPLPLLARADEVIE